MNPNIDTPKSQCIVAPFATNLARGALLLAVMASTPAIAQTVKDTVRWDDRAAQWVYTLYNPSDLTQSKEVRYTPRTLIEPVVKSKVQRDKDLYEYSYRVKNSGGARQSINGISVRAPKWEVSVPQRSAPVSGESHAQVLARVRSDITAIDQFVGKTLYSPSRWKPFLNVNQPTRVVFGWLVDSNKTYAGIAPRTSQGSFSALRVELPGAGWMEMQGDTPDMYNAATLPSAGATADQVSTVLAEDSIYVPVLLPAIVLPNPYNGAELARRLKAHVATWPDAGLMDAESFVAVNPQLDVLIKALTANDKNAVKAAVQTILTQARKHQPGMSDANTDDDDDANDSKSSKRIFVSARGTLEEVSESAAPIHRIAVRALAFNMKYLVSQMEGAGR